MGGTPERKRNKPLKIGSIMPVFRGVFDVLETVGFRTQIRAADIGMRQSRSGLGRKSFLRWVLTQPSQFFSGAPFGYPAGKWWRRWDSEPKSVPQISGCVRAVPDWAEKAFCDGFSPSRHNFSAGHPSDAPLENGGDGGIRTHDLCVANASLSQLSYAPWQEKAKPQTGWGFADGVRYGTRTHGLQGHNLTR